MHLPSHFEDIQHLILVTTRPGQLAVDYATGPDQPWNIDATSMTELERVTGNII